MAEKTTSQTNRGMNGVVLSHKTDKTAIVLVSRYVKHPKYGKYIVKEKKYKAHDEKNEYQPGDKVRIAACRPVSKEKKFKVVEKI